MLTKTQRKMIEERKEIGDTPGNERRKYIDFTLRNFIKKQLSSVVEISEVLDTLPGDQIRTLIDAENIIGILKVLEKISSICLAPIEVDEKGQAHAVYRFQLVQKLQDPIEGKDQKIINMRCLFLAEPWEIEFAEKLGTDEFKPYMRVLTNLFENEFGLIRFDIEENETYVNWLNDLVAKRGQMFKLEAGQAKERIKRMGTMSLIPRPLCPSTRPHIAQIGSVRRSGMLQEASC